MKKYLISTVIFALTIGAATGFAAENALPMPAGAAALTVFVDAAHGGMDPGAANSAGVREKDLTLTLSKRIGEILHAYSVGVVYSRNVDKTISLEDRAQMVLESQPDAAVSIHLDASRDANRNGFSILLDGRNQAASSLAALIRDRLDSVGLLSDMGIESTPLAMAAEMGPRPLVVLDIGYVTNANDLAALADPKSQAAICAAVASGILAWLGVADSSVAG